MHTVLVNLSHRHIHLTKTDIEALFGPAYSLSKKADLLQPGQFAAQEVVTIAGPRGEIRNVRVVGPERADTQCEILTGDTYTLGFSREEVPIRLSGDITGSAAFTITGPAGSVYKPQGLIIAQRHIHINPDEAAAKNLTHGQPVTVRCETPLKQTDLHSVTIRIQEGAIFECHIDIEEGNAAGISSGYKAEILT